MFSLNADEATGVNMDRILNYYKHDGRHPPVLQPELESGSVCPVEQLHEREVIWGGDPDSVSSSQVMQEAGA